MSFFRRGACIHPCILGADRLAKLLGGELRVSDRTDGATGVRFQLLLPIVLPVAGAAVAAAASAAPAAEAEAAPATATAAPGDAATRPRDVALEEKPSWDRITLRRTVLVVDDLASNRRLARRMLQQLGCDVCVEATDGDEVLAAIMSSSTPVDVILMDIEMRRSNGVSAVAAVRAAGLSTPVIAVTGNADAERTAFCA